jgi:hypothetical protein
MDRKLCEGCLRKTSRHKLLNKETMIVRCGFCRKEVSFLVTSKRTSPPTTHYISKTNPSLTKTKPGREARRSTRSRR